MNLSYDGSLAAANSSGRKSVVSGKLGAQIIFIARIVPHQNFPVWSIIQRLATLLVQIANSPRYKNC